VQFTLKSHFPEVEIGLPTKQINFTNSNTKLIYGKIGEAQLKLVKLSNSKSLRCMWKHALPLHS
jgi:hypothetical protein